MNYNIDESTTLPGFLPSPGLLGNDNIRVSLANAGNLYVRKFDWKVSTLKMYNFLSSLK